MVNEAFLGCDVSKGYCDFLLLDQSKKVLEEGFQLEDNQAGRQGLKSIIEGWFSKGLKKLYCGLESTGGYENNWYEFVRNLSTKMDVQVARLNARAVKALSDASLKRTITDAVSAHNIASYLISFPEKVDYWKSEAGQLDRFKEGRQYSSYIRMLLKQKVQLNNQLEKLLYQHFSEILIYCRHGVPGWLLRMLSRYPCADLVKNAGVTKLSGIKGISADKSKALIQKAHQSSQSVSRQTQHLISMTSKEILHKEELIEGEKKYLTHLYEQDEQVQLLSSIDGVGKTSAVGLMLEIENITRFASGKKIAAYFGVHPTFKQSGDGTWGSHMSKKGRGEIRSILYMTALTGIRCNPILKQLYARFRAKGMKHYQVMGTVMHKLLRIIYGVLKNKSAFNADIDQKNTRMSEERAKKENGKIEKIREQKKHRYQVVSENAPVSNRAAKRRKKQIAS